jgi:hypothetical protein
MNNLFDAPKGSYIVSTTEKAPITCTAVYVLEAATFSSILFGREDVRAQLFQERTAILPAGTLIRLSGGRKINSVTLGSGKVMLIL